MQTDDTLTYNIAIMQDDKITIPSRIREKLGLYNGRGVMLIEDDEYIRIVNPLRYALSKAQKAMEGAAEEAGWKSDDDVVEYIMEMRRNSR